MATARTARTYQAPIEDVFEAFVDHEALAGVPGIRSARLSRRGDTEKNGKGAVREVDAWAVRFTEHIVGFDRPHSMEYRIASSFPPMLHELGLVQFSDSQNGVVVTWTSRFRTRLPALIGRPVEFVAALGASVAFSWVLRCLESRLEARHARS